MSHLDRPLVLRVAIWFVPLFLIPWGTCGVDAQEKSSVRLFPDSTIAFGRIANVQEFIASFQATSFGRMFNDAEVQPLMSDLWRGFSSFAEEDVQDGLGMSIGDLLSIPQGEVAIGVAVPEGSQPALMVMIDVGDRLTLAEQVLDLMESDMIADGASESTEEVGDVTLRVYSGVGGADREMVVFVREDVVSLVQDLELAKQMVAAANGEVADDKSLADNRRFTTIMKHCEGTKGERPQLSWFLDPITLLKRISQGNFGMTAVVGMLPTLGLDGLKALGGSVIMNTEEFDSISHVHLSLSSPRNGVLAMLALESGETEPEAWVPSDVASYSTFNWNLEETYLSAAKLVDGLNGEGALGRMIERRFSEPLGIDFETDLLAQLEGRATLITWVEKPARLNSQSMLLGIKLTNPERFRETLLTLTQRFANGLENASFSGIRYQRVRQNDEVPLAEDIFRRAAPCFGIVGDYFLLTDSENLLQEVMKTSRLSVGKKFSSELDFKLIANKIERQVGGKSPAVLMFSRVEESMQALYDFAQSDGVRGQLSANASENPVFGTLNQSLNNHPLPPFSVLAKYLAPRGAMVTSDATGFHYTAFSLKRD